MNNIDIFHVNMLLDGGSNISVNIFIFAKFVFTLPIFNHSILTWNGGHCDTFLKGTHTPSQPKHILPWSYLGFLNPNPYDSFRKLVNSLPIWQSWTQNLVLSSNQIYCIPQMVLWMSKLSMADDNLNLNVKCIPSIHLWYVYQMYVSIPETYQLIKKTRR